MRARVWRPSRPDPTFRRHAIAIGAALGFGCLYVSSASGQARCTDGVISAVDIVSQDPLGEDATSEDATFGWVFRTMNSIHAETRPRVLGWELLFEVGSCYDEDRLRESERNLRSLPYISDATITSERTADGGHRIRVVTRDTWALSANLSVDFEGGIAVTGFTASHRNVLGSGLRAAYFRRAFRERLRTGGLARHTNLFGSRIDATVHGGRTRAGSYFNQSLRRPFLNEYGNHAFRQVVARIDDYFGYSLPPGLGFTPAYLRYRADLVEFSYQLRLGPQAGRRPVLGVGLSHESFDTPFGPEGARAVVDGDYRTTVAAPTQVLDAISVQAEPYQTKRLSTFIGMRDVRYETRGRLDAIEAIQDVLVGGDVLLTVAPGFALTSDDRADLFTRLQGRFGLLGDHTYVLARVDAHARRIRGDAPRPDGWRDMVGSATADVYWTQSAWSGLYARGRASGGWSTDRPFQLTLGGRDGIRAYAEDAFPGGRLVFGSLEQRVRLRSLSPSFADLGLAAFADAGRMWAGDAPFGLDSGWRSGIGAGIRASGSGGRRVVRVDASLPLTGQRAERGVTLRIYGEIFGALDRRRWPTQLERSRWYGNDPDLSTRLPDPLARR